MKDSQYFCGLCLFAPVKALYFTVFRVLILGEEIVSCGEEEQMNLTAA